jgi:DNA mismatch repair ATPase MutL
MPSQRPFFLASVFAALRQQDLSITQQPNKYATQTTSSAASSSPANATATSTAAGRTANAGNTPSASNNQAADTAGQAQTTTRSANIPIQYPSSRRRGSDSSSEGFRDVLGADKWYIGGRTAGGEERFFKLGVVRRVRSNDGLSLDRLSL